MTIRNKNLVNGVLIGTSDTTLYTVPTSLLRTILTQVRVTNNGSGVAVLNLWVLQPGDTVTDATAAIINKNIGVDETIILTSIINEVIAKGGSIQATSDLATSLYFSASGLEVTS